MDYTLKESIPLRIEKRASIIFGVFELIMGIAIVGLLFLVFFSEFSTRDFRSSSIYLVLTVPGWVFVFGGWYLISSWKVIEIDNGMVCVVMKGIWNLSEWQEPLENYMGVKITSEPRFKPDNLPMPGRIYRIFLKHPDTEKNVSLYREVSLNRAIERWISIGNCLGLALIETPKVKREREAYLS